MLCVLKTKNSTTFMQLFDILYINCVLYCIDNNPYIKIEIETKWKGRKLKENFFRAAENMYP